MIEIVERVARAIFADLGWEGVGAHPSFERDRELWEGAARGAIEAMREPTDEIWKAWVDIGIDQPPDQYWQAAIDEALKVQS